MWWSNSAHALDGGIPSCFHIGRRWPAASDELADAPNAAIAPRFHSEREWRGVRVPHRSVQKQ